MNADIKICFGRYSAGAFRCWILPWQSM